MRWLVGDVQGCALELDRLLQAIRFDPGRDELWCLGDLINRGPNSLAVVRAVRDIGAFSLLGNHEIHALLAYSGRVRKRRPHLAELFEAPDADELLALLRSSAVLRHLPAPGGAGRDVWVVHAGLDPRWSDLPEVARRVNGADHDDAWLTSDDVLFATSVRCCTPAGEMCDFSGPPADCPAPYVPWNELYRGDTLVVHGHWAMRGYYRAGNVMGLDSGCVYGGALTAWCQEDDRIVQIPAGGGPAVYEPTP